MTCRSCYQYNEVKDDYIPPPGVIIAVCPDCGRRVGLQIICELADFER